MKKTKKMVLSYLQKNYDVMKKIILFIVFLTSVPTIVISQNFEDMDLSGVYFSPYTGYCFGDGNGLSTGISVGYRFNNSIILEADGSYRKIIGEYAYQAKTSFGYDFQFDNFMSIDMLIGGGAVFLHDKTIPMFGFRFGIGGNVFKNIINLSVYYDSETLFDTKNFEGMEYAHGIMLRARFLIPSKELEKKGKQ